MTTPLPPSHMSYFFFNDPATTEIYTSVHTLSLHDALPISSGKPAPPTRARRRCWTGLRSEEHTSELQSRTLISYAVFCLKKKKKNNLFIRCGECTVKKHDIIQRVLN